MNWFTNLVRRASRYFTGGYTLTTQGVGEVSVQVIVPVDEYVRWHGSRDERLIPEVTVRISHENSDWMPRTEPSMEEDVLFPAISREMEEMKNDEVELVVPLSEVRSVVENWLFMRGNRRVTPEEHDSVARELSIEQFKLMESLQQQYWAMSK